mmetsp:Transcript_12949/g.19407  ORF Transcript_12949/g.19407 Transcript_12949/m.19407 type:complete len:82 (-) Transcript_12949:1727-1972(-)
MLRLPLEQLEHFLQGSSPSVERGLNDCKSGAEATVLGVVGVCGKKVPIGVIGVAGKLNAAGLHTGGLLSLSVFMGVRVAFK